MKESLDIFSQFFQSPLFTATATERELQAVNNEHQKNLSSDAWRIYQVEKTAANSAHPFSRFATGDLTTLYTTPLQRNINVREALLEFHRVHYVAPSMRLVVLGRESLEELETWTRELFSGVPSGDESLVRVSLPDPYPPALLCRRLSIVSIRDSHTVEVSWCDFCFVASETH